MPPEGPGVKAFEARGVIDADLPVPADEIRLARKNPLTGWSKVMWPSLTPLSSVSNRASKRPDATSQREHELAGTSGDNDRRAIG